MELTDQQRLPVPQARAWIALNDTELLKTCIPGCESLTPTEEGRYEVVLVAAIGPVKAKFKGRLQLADSVPPESYTMHFEGQGGMAGHGKGKAQVRLEPTGASETTLHYSAQAAIGGKIAQIGSRLVDMAAKKIAGEFFDRFRKELELRADSAKT